MPFLVAGLLLLVAGLAAMVVSSRRSTRRATAQLVHVAARLDGPAQEASDLPTALWRLNRAVDASLQRAAQQRRLAEALGSALDAMPLGVVVAGQGGEVIFRNDSAAALFAARGA
ncbi:MAG: hypothetical protein M3N68_14215, partial [Actinomycetota bacterium]|nr:hypothetical protein [Actinomycetota bacterium]